MSGIQQKLWEETARGKREIKTKEIFTKKANKEKEKRKEPELTAKGLCKGPVERFIQMQSVKRNCYCC